MQFLLFSFTVLIVLLLNLSLVVTQIVSCAADQACVPSHQCKADGTIITDGYNLLGVRIDEECDTGNFKQCCKKPPSKKTEPADRLDIPKCGFIKNELSVRIGGGEEAKPGQFPWNVAFLNETKIFGEVANIYFCGGTLIHPRVVLTAAHCVNGHDSTKMIVRAGELDLKKGDEKAPHQDRKVFKVVVHKDYIEGNLFNDIALVFLDNDFKIEGNNDNVAWICIPKLEQSFVGKFCSASGFGRSEVGGQFPTNLTAASVKIRSQDDCTEKLRKTRLGEYFELNERFICAGGEKGVDACEGDGGSPLSCQIAENRYCLSGIVSWGIDCGIEDVPGVYVNVAYFREWIDERMFEENLIPMHSED